MHVKWNVVIPHCLLILVASVLLLLQLRVTKVNADTTVASDAFTRSVSSGWGSADTGGSYTLTGTSSDFNVTGTEGTMNNPSSSTARVAALASVSNTDVDITFKVKTNKVAAGTAQEVFFIARYIDASNMYRGKIRLTTTNTVTLQSGKLVSGVETLLGSQNTVSGLSYSADGYIKVRVQVTGTNPTTINMKAWLDGNSEPGTWTHTTTDSEATLQAAGGVGLRTNLPGSTSNAPVLFTFDDFAVTSADALPSPTPTITPSPTPTPPPQSGLTLLSDTFTRSVTDGWGTPTTGGDYVVIQGSGADFDVTGSAGTIVSQSASTTHAVVENDSSQQDIDIQFEVKTDKIPTGSAAEIFWLGRRTEAGDQYRGKIRLTTASGVTLQATKYVSGTETALGSQTGTGITLATDTYIYVRSQVTGTNPTTINMKAWLATDPEPSSWQYTTTDSEASLQTEGSIGLRTNMPSGVTNAPITLTFDNINVTTGDAQINSTLAPPQSGTVFAADNFTRSVSSGWGTADTGGAYTLTNGAAANFNVTGTEGTMLSSTSSVTRSVILASTSQQDVDIKFKAKVDTVPTGNAVEVYWVARRIDANNQYRGKVRFTTGSTITLQAANVISGTETLLGTQVAPGITYTADQYVYVRGKVVGTNPTTLYMKAWLASDVEPVDWQYTVDDNQVQTLQTSGSIGLRTNLPGTVSNAPITVTFDSLNATSTDIDVAPTTTVSSPTPSPTGGVAYTATIDLAGSATVSKLSVGATHIQESANTGSNASAVTAAKALLSAGLTYQNQHVVGFGVSNLWDDPSKSVSQWNWTSLDNRVKLMRDTSSTPILTLCCAPTWMVDATWSPGKYNGSNTDWGLLEEAPLPEFEDEFAYMVSQIVQRYDGVKLDSNSVAYPNILYYQVWNEMKGMWYSAGNRWDYDRYNRLYGLVYDAIKAVRPAANVGGPYVRMAAYKNPNGTQNSTVTGTSYGTVDKRNLDVVTQWLTWLDTHRSGGNVKAQFITVDGGINVKDVVDGSFPTDIFAATQVFADVNSWMQSEMTSVIGAQLPIWWAEDYVGKVNGNPVLITPESQQPAALAMLLYRHLYAGTTVSLRWGPEEQVSDQGVAQGNKQNLYTSTQFVGGGQAYENYNVYKYFHDHFEDGTSVYPVNISPSTSILTVIASSAKALLINRSSSTLSVDVVQNGSTTSTTLDPYEVELMDVPGEAPSPTPTPTPSNTPTPSLTPTPSNTPTPTPTDTPTPTPSNTPTPTATDTPTPTPSNTPTPTPSDTPTPTPTDTPTPTPSNTPTPTEAPTPTETPTPTPTPDPNASPTPTSPPPENHGSPPVIITNTTSAPVCGNSKPGSAPWLYAVVNRSRDSIEIFFNPPNEPYDNFVVEFGIAPGQYLYSATGLGKSSRQFTIDHLAPNATYYIRVRAGNGCATGDWSNEMSNRNIVNRAVGALRTILPSRSAPIRQGVQPLLPQAIPQARPQVPSVPKSINPPAVDIRTPQPVIVTPKPSLWTAVTSFLKNLFGR